MHIKPHGHDGVHYVFMTCSRLFLLSPFACLTLVPLSFVLFAPMTFPFDSSISLVVNWIKKQQQQKII